MKKWKRKVLNGKRWSWWHRKLFDINSENEKSPTPLGLVAKSVDLTAGADWMLLALYLQSLSIKMCHPKAKISCVVSHFLLSWLHDVWCIICESNLIWGVSIFKYFQFDMNNFVSTEVPYREEILLLFLFLSNWTTL